MASMDNNTLALLGVAAFNAVTAYLTWRTHNIALKQTDTIQLLEKNTNSIKDALVASTAKASRAEGVAAGRMEEKFDTSNRT